jgi:hypothetical protein
MTQDHGDLIVRDLGSTNGIRINGQRVEMGRLRPGDELSIAHIRFRLDAGTSQDLTQAGSESSNDRADGHFYPFRTPNPPASHGNGKNGHGAAAVMSPPSSALLKPQSADSPLAAAVRELLPSSVAERCRIQVIVRMDPDSEVSSVSSS